MRHDFDPLAARSEPGLFETETSASASPQSRRGLARANTRGVRATYCLDVRDRGEMRKSRQQACLGPIIGRFGAGGWPRIDKEILFGAPPHTHTFGKITMATSDAPTPGVSIWVIPGLKAP